MSYLGVGRGRMQTRLEPGAQGRDGEFRGQYLDIDAARPVDRRAVARVTPGQQTLVLHQMRRAVHLDKCAVRQIVEGRPPTALASDGAVDAVLVQGPIHGFGARRLGQVQRRLPGGAPRVIILASAFVARAMSGGDGDCFVQKEEFRVAVRRHHVALTAAKHGEADDPIVVCPAPPAEFFCVAVQNTAIAHEIAARRIRLDGAERCHSVLQRHGSNAENGSQKIRPLDEPVLVDAVPEVRATQGLHREIAFL